MTVTSQAQQPFNWRDYIPIHPAAEAEHKAVSPNDIALNEFDRHVLRLVQMTRGHRPERFARTAVPVRYLVQLAAFLDGVWRAIDNAAASAEAMKAKHAALDMEAAE